MQSGRIHLSVLSVLSALAIAIACASAFAQTAGAPAGTPGAPAGTGGTNGIGPAPQPTPGQVTSVPPPANTSPGFGPAPQPTPGQVTNVPVNPSGASTGSSPH